ncbi:MAG: DUF4198 domain-containing protein [Rubrivivax sp.]|nr:DUF4198 domain-containing protein [Rubrivivax sp.]
MGGRGRGFRRVACLAALVPAVAAAHDTWLEQRPAPAGNVELALTSGELFPTAQTSVAASSLIDSGCVSTSGRRVLLRAGKTGPSALTLHAAPLSGDPVAACWVQTDSFDVELTARLVPIYLREIAAPESVRQAWAAYQQQGLPWLERYTKHARISLSGQPGGPPPPSASLSASPSPSPAMALDIEIEAVGRLRAGDTLRFRVLRDGQPLAGQAVELRGDMSPLGLWRQTDSEGRASVPVPFAGRWVLRATDLRPVPDRPGHWESRFVTHAFSVEAAARPAGVAERTLTAALGTHTRIGARTGPDVSYGNRQPKSPSMPKARSANHSSATPTMSTEPPISTAWR